MYSGIFDASQWDFNRWETGFILCRFFQLDFKGLELNIYFYKLSGSKMELKNPNGGPFSTTEVAKILHGKGVITKTNTVSSWQQKRNQ